MVYNKDIGFFIIDYLKFFNSERSIILRKQHKFLNICLFSSAALLSIAGINKLIFVSSTIKDILKTEKNLSYDWRFGKIHYTVQGSGTPILLIHDFLAGSSDFEWKNIIKDLAKSHTVYTLDLLGFGRSEKPAITYTNYLYVQLITDFIKSVIGRRCDIITSGSSSAIAIMACRIDTSLINRMMFISPDSLSKTTKVPNKKSKTLKFLLELPLVGTFIYNLMVNKNRFETDFKKYYFSDPILVSTQLIDAYEEASHLHGANSRYVYSSLVGNYINFSISHALSEIDNSIYIINGEDTLGYQQLEKDYQQKNASIETGTIAHSKHFPQLENPSSLLEHCKIFFG